MSLLFLPRARALVFSTCLGVIIAILYVYLYLHILFSLLATDLLLPTLRSMLMLTRSLDTLPASILLALYVCRCIWLPVQANPQYNYAEEVNNLVKALADPSLAQANGIKVGGNKYMYIRSHKDENSGDQFLVGNKGGAGVSVRKTKTGVLIGVSAPAASAPSDLAIFKAAAALIKANA